MNTAIWTLWLLTFAPVTGQGAAQPIITELSTFGSQESCLNGIRLVDQGLRSIYAPTKTDSPPSIGVFFCVPGNPAKH